MSTYMGVTNFQKTVRFFGPPCTLYVNVLWCCEKRNPWFNNEVFEGWVYNGNPYPKLDVEALRIAYENFRNHVHVLYFGPTESNANRVYICFCR